MQGLSHDLEIDIVRLEFERDDYIKRLELTEDSDACRRYLRQISEVDVRITRFRRALAATTGRRKSPTLPIPDPDQLHEVQLVGDDPDDNGVEIPIEVVGEEFDEAPTEMFRWPTAPYPAVRERFVHTTYKPLQLDSGRATDCVPEGSLATVFRGQRDRREDLTE